MAWNTDLRWRLPLTCLLLQVALVVLFGVFVRYNPDADAHWVEDKQHANSSSDLDNEFYSKAICFILLIKCPPSHLTRENFFRLLISVWYKISCMNANLQ